MMVGMGVRITSQSMTLALLLVAGRFLDAELFGVFVLASIVMNFAIVQMYTGVYHYVLKQPDFEASEGTAFSLQLMTGAFYGVVILAAAGIAWAVGGDGLLVQLMAATALVPLIITVSSWQEAILLRRGEVKYYYGALLLAEVAGFCVALTMLMNGAGVWSLIVNRYCSAVGISLLLSFRSGRLPRLAFHREHASAIFRYSAGLYGNSALSFFSGSGAEIILGSFLSARAVGLFRMGARTSTAAYDIFAQTFRVLTWQAVGRMAREERLTPTLWTRLIAINLCIMTFVLGSLSLLATELTILLLGEKWLGMVPVLQVFCWLKVLNSVDMIASAQLAAAGYSKFLVRARSLEAGLTLVVLLASVQFGMMAVAYSLFIPAAIYISIILWKLMRLTEASVGRLIMTVAPGLLLSGGSLAVVYAVSRALSVDSGLIVILLTAVAGSGAYLAIAFGPLRAWTLKTLQTVSVAILPAQDSGERHSSGQEASSVSS